MAARLIAPGVAGAGGGWGVRVGGLLVGCSTACLRVLDWGMLSLLAKLAGGPFDDFFFFSLASSPMRGSDQGECMLRTMYEAELRGCRFPLHSTDWFDCVVLAGLTVSLL